MPTEALRNSVEVYEHGIRSVEKIREQLLKRLELAAEEAKPRIRDSLTQNEKALVALRDALAAAQNGVGASPAIPGRAE